MTRTAGTASVLQATASGGATYGVTLTAYARNISPRFANPSVDATTIGDGTVVGGGRTYVPGFKEGSLAIDGIYEAAVPTFFEGIRGGSASPMRYYPQGTATGFTYHQFSFVLDEASYPTAFDDMVTFTATGRTSGAVTLGTA